MDKDKKFGDYIKGRGAQIVTANRFLKTHYDSSGLDGIDSPDDFSKSTRYFVENPKQIVNKVDSPDVFLDYSVNPYQGCEHGCIYCYARNSHQYWGFSSGLDFEQNIIVKQNAPQLLREFFDKNSWRPATIAVSGNTDCYQPCESKFKLTRGLLEVFLEYKNPVGIITKNALIARDIDLLKELAKDNLVHVMVSITTLDEELRRSMEPRTVSGKKRLEILSELSENGIPCGVLVAPIIPGLNSMEIPEILNAASQAGAVNAGYTMVRLNGDIATLFQDWIEKTFPDKAQKVLSQIADCHGGSLQDNRFGIRMRGEGKVAEAIRQLFKISYAKSFQGKKAHTLNHSLFKRPPKHGQMELF
ncbi:MAG: PA0069 family radical SAM protein [Bacteroidia bacterium]|nr:PA0069 family radical SAM protein [Bacteroidia bacterium]